MDGQAGAAEDNSLAVSDRSGSSMGMTVYLTVREVAAMARCEHKSVRRAITSGHLQAFRPAYKLLIREADAEAWIERQPAVASTPARPLPGRRSLRPTMGSQRAGSVAELREIERKVVRA
jgi:excisionase family DNA binding protein